MKPYRIVEFENGQFALEVLILGFIPTRHYQDLEMESGTWTTSHRHFRCCLSPNIEKLYDYLKRKQRLNYKIKRVIHVDQTQP